MQVCEKIKHLRQAQNLSQEEVAEKLGMTANGYGGIERGEVDIKLSRLQQLSELFSVELFELLDRREQNVFNFSDATTQNHWNISSKSPEHTNFKHEIEKLQLVVEKLESMLESQKAEISYLKEIIELMKKSKS
ncbi:MAG: helix-turn-helix transcriptional regulator [Methylococcaceae bacterium]